MSTILREVCPKLAVAVEISAAKWVVASCCGGGRKIRRKVLCQESPSERFEALLEELVAARRQFGLPEDARTVVAYEAGQEGFWLVRALLARGIEAQVINPASLQVDRRARRAKTDRLDSQALVSSLWRYLEGEEQALRMVRIPSEQAEDEREWQRERDRLQGERRGCADRIRKKLRTQGLWQPPRDWRKRLREGRLQGYHGPLGPTLQAMLVLELERLEAAEAKLKTLLERCAELTPLAAQRIEALARLRGIGRVGARGLALLLYWRKFNNRRQVGGCVGLVSAPYDSGLMRQDQGITKEGDPRLRASLIELAWLWLRHQPDSAIARWFAQRTQGQGARGKRVMIVGVARRLAIALWRYLEHGLIPEGARLKNA